MKANNPSIEKIEKFKPDDQIPIGRIGDDRALVTTFANLFARIKAAFNLTRLDGFSSSNTSTGTFDGKPIVLIDTGLTDTAGLIAIPTIELPVGETAKFYIDSDGSLTAWQLRAGTSTHRPDQGICRPSDYNAGSNEKIWRRIL